MSIICWLMGVTPAQIAALRGKPSIAGSLVKVALDKGFKARFDEVIKGMSPAQRRKFDDNQAPALADAEARDQVASLGSLEPAMTLEKSWYMLHYLFTGHVVPGSAPGDSCSPARDWVTMWVTARRCCIARRRGASSAISSTGRNWSDCKDGST
jgi:hypothetical protein